MDYSFLAFVPHLPECNGSKSEVYIGKEVYFEVGVEVFIHSFLVSLAKNMLHHSYYRCLLHEKLTTQKWTQFLSSLLDKPVTTVEMACQ